MALSQVQCLDDHHVNSRVSESKPEFFYSEDHRIALEALVCKGREAFISYLKEHGVREFLSEPELERLAHTFEVYRPGCEHLQKSEGTGNTTPGAGEDGDGTFSLQYWPDKSEASVAELDLGWPESISYRGVTRATVYTQPPTEGHTHIKEVVRRSIASAQKVIAVVMDAFTDADIFRDLLDISYRRRIPVYVIIDTAAVPCFLSMCGRADMHRGHLKNLRVRCCGGVEFYTRSAQKVRGSLSQKFLLVDGDRAISGSYSFTWTSSRLDRNLITVITGQAVETFDQQFRDLYLVSRGVSLSKVSMVDEPIPDPVPVTAPVPVPASVARKLINPKYALVTTGTHASPTSSDQNSSNKNSNPQLPAGLRLFKMRAREPIEQPPLHPGLAHLERAYLIPYLPTWPEPDPPKDVIGFINIRDDKRAHQVHLQRSERFEVSQAIRFSSPIKQHTPQDTNTPKENTVKASAAKGPSPTPVADLPVPQLDEQKQTDVTDSSGSPQQPKIPIDSPKAEHAEKPSSPNLTPGQPNEETAVSPEVRISQSPSPPVPKPRTLQLVIEQPPSEQSSQPKVSLIKRDQSDMPMQIDCSHLESQHTHSQLKKVLCDERDSNAEGSGDSTKVICDKTLNDHQSSISTASEEEFYDCNQQDPKNQISNGVTSGSGRGHRQGDGVNMMARLSQSMLDLRVPNQSEDSAALLKKSQQLRRDTHSSPNRQLLQTSRARGLEGQMRRAKVVLAKPGSYHRPTRASGPVIGGYRYWQSQALPLDTGQLPRETRSGRSPRRHSPGHRKTGHTGPRPAANQTTPMGVSYLKGTSHRHLRPRGYVGNSQKKYNSGKDVS